MNMLQVFSDDSAFKEPNPPTSNGLDCGDGQTVVSVCIYIFFLHVYCSNHRCTPQLDHFAETETVLHQHNKTSRNVFAKTNFLKEKKPLFDTGGSCSNQTYANTNNRYIKVTGN